MLVLIVSACSTEPASPLPDATRVVVIGDFGTGDADQMAVAGAIRAEHETAPLDGLITTGDNIYPDGGPEFFEDAWRKPYGWVRSHGVGVFASLGNHDVARDPSPVMRLLDMPGRWYEAHLGPLHIIVLDSNAVEDAEQQLFLRRALTSPLRQGEYRIVVLHHPPHSCAKHGSTPAVLESWGPLLEAAEVHLVVSGHDHVYERFGVVSGTTHVVTGGGGNDLYEMGPCPVGTPPLRAQAERHHYVLVEATEERLRLQAISPDGDRLDIADIPG